MVDDVRVHSKLETRRIAIVTGANRGIGFEISRQLYLAGLEVVLTARSEEKGRAALDKLLSLVEVHG